jgi:hypothetical protein
MKLKIKEEDFNVVKAYFQLQILLETLDEVYDESKMNLKGATKNYLNVIKVRAEKILNGMYQTNPNLYEKICNELREDVDKIEKHFEII